MLHSKVQLLPLQVQCPHLKTQRLPLLSSNPKSMKYFSFTGTVSYVDGEQNGD